ncbi:hypothetical protein U1Q18_008961 [Sarracenia purpurea var. burkii]
MRGKKGSRGEKGSQNLYRRASPRFCYASPSTVRFSPRRRATPRLSVATISNDVARHGSLDLCLTLTKQSANGDQLQTHDLIKICWHLKQWQQPNQICFSRRSTRDPSSDPLNPNPLWVRQESQRLDRGGSGGFHDGVPVMGSVGLPAGVIQTELLPMGPAQIDYRGHCCKPSCFQWV